MTAKTAGFVSRAECGLRAPRSVSHNITPEQGGVAIHHGGNGPKPAPVTLEAAIKVWQAWQRHHMDGNGWADIAYTVGITQTGHVLAGRGLGVRTAAQGTNQGNDDYYAAVWIGGGGDIPTVAAYDAFDWFILHARQKGGAGLFVPPHKKFTSTTCPDLKLTAFAASRNGQAITLPGVTPAPKPAPIEPKFPLPRNHWYGIDDGTPYSHSGKSYRGKDDYWVRRIQRVVGTRVDGDFGPNTARSVKSYVDKRVSSRVDLGNRTKVGPKVWSVLF